MTKPTAFNYHEYLQVLDDLTHAVSVIKTDAETIMKLSDALQAVSADARMLKDEVCLRCGQYREAHNGACDGCRWKDYSPEVYTNG